jgi:hypothetical protein
VSGSSSDEEEFVPIENLETQFQPSRPLPPRKRDFYTSDSSDKEVIQKISDDGIGGDEGVNMKKNIEEGIEEDIEKGIEEGIKEVVEQVIEEVVEEFNIEEGTGDPPKLRRSGMDRKQTRKSLAYYRDLREMKDKRSGYEEGHRV